MVFGMGRRVQQQQQQPQAWRGGGRQENETTTTLLPPEMETSSLISSWTVPTKTPHPKQLTRKPEFVLERFVALEEEQVKSQVKTCVPPHPKGLLGKPRNVLERFEALEEGQVRSQVTSCVPQDSTNPFTEAYCTDTQKNETGPKTTTREAQSSQSPTKPRRLKFLPRSTQPTKHNNGNKKVLERFVAMASVRIMSRARREDGAFCDTMDEEDKHSPQQHPPSSPNMTTLAGSFVALDNTHTRSLETFVSNLTWESLLPQQRHPEDDIVVQPRRREYYRFDDDQDTFVYDDDDEEDGITWASFDGHDTCLAWQMGRFWCAY